MKAKEIPFNGDELISALEDTAEELRIQRIVKEIRAEVEKYSDGQLLDYLEKENPTVIQDCFGIRVAHGEAKDNWRNAIREAIETEIFDGKLRKGEL